MLTSSVLCQRGAELSEDVTDAANVRHHCFLSFYLQSLPRQSALSQGNLELKPADLPALHALSIVLSNIYPLSLLQNHISYNFKCDFLLGEDYVRALYQNLFTSFDPTVGLGALCGEGEKPQRPQHKMQKRF